VNELQGFCVLYKHNRSYLFQEGCTMYDLLLTPAHMYPYVEGFWSLLHCPTSLLPSFWLTGGSGVLRWVQSNYPELYPQNIVDYISTPSAAARSSYRCVRHGESSWAGNETTSLAEVAVLCTLNWERDFSWHQTHVCTRSVPLIRPPFCTLHPA